MFISLINRIDLRGINCAAKESSSLPAFNLHTEQYYDDCSIRSTDIRIFSQRRLTDDKVYGFIVDYRTNLRFADSTLYFTNAIYNRIISCSGGNVTMKNVIDKLILAYPHRVYVRDAVSCDPIYPLSIDTISGSVVDGKLQITLNVSGNTSGNVRIVWGSLANVDVVTIDPAKITSATYEKTLPAGAYLICATVV